MDNIKWPPFKKKTVSIGLTSAKRVIAMNWKTIKNINENNWLKTFERLLSLEKMSSSICTPTSHTWKKVKSHIYLLCLITSNVFCFCVFVFL